MALTIPIGSSNRFELLRLIAAEQVRVGDAEFAMRVGAALGDWRREVQMNVACRLLEDRRFDDAERLALSLPPTDRDWALAHVASQFARPPLSPRRRGDSVDTVALVRRAVGVARAIRSPNARLDALLSIAQSQLSRSDTAGSLATVRLARSAVDDVRDPDFAVSRRMHVAGLLGSAGHTDDALRILHTLPPQEQIALAWYSRGWPGRNTPAVRAALARIADVVAKSPDPNARANGAMAVSEALKEAGDSSAAASVARRFPAINPATGRPWVPNDVVRTPGADIDSLAYAQSFAHALESAARIPDTARVGLRARAYLRFVELAYNGNRDTIRLALERASMDARASSLSERPRDDLLTHVARAQLGHAFYDDGLATVGAIRDPDQISFALGAIAAAPGTTLSANDRVAIMMRVANVDGRRRAILGFVTGTLTMLSPMSQPPSGDVVWARAFADSVADGAERDVAQVAVARYLLTHNDASTARRLLLALAPTHRVNETPPWYDRDRLDDVAELLVTVGADADAVRWARATIDQTAGAIALYTIAHALARRAAIGQEQWVSNGPDRCREEF